MAAAMRVAAEGRAVVARLEDAHHRLVGEDAGDRVEAARERLADDHDVGPDALVLEGEELAGAAETGLDLVDDEQCVVLLGDLAQPLAGSPRAATTMPASPWMGSTRTAATFGVHGRLDGAGVAVGEDPEAGGEGPEAVAVVRLGGEADDGVVRPWKLLLKTRISALPSGTPLTL